MKNLPQFDPSWEIEKQKLWYDQQRWSVETIKEIAMGGTLKTSGADNG